MVETEAIDVDELDDGIIRVNIKTPNTHSREPFFIEVDRNITVEAFKVIVAEKIDIEPERQRLIFHGRALSNSETLASYNIVNGNTIHLVPRLRAPDTEASAAPAPAPVPAPAPTQNTTQPVIPPISWANLGDLGNGQGSVSVGTISMDASDFNLGQGGGDLNSMLSGIINQAMTNVVDSTGGDSGSGGPNPMGIPMPSIPMPTMPSANPINNNASSNSNTSQRQQQQTPPQNNTNTNTNTQNIRVTPQNAEQSSRNMIQFALNLLNTFMAQTGQPSSFAMTGNILEDLAQAMQGLSIAFNWLQNDIFQMTLDLRRETHLTGIARNNLQQSIMTQSNLLRQLSLLSSNLSTILASISLGTAPGQTSFIETGVSHNNARINVQPRIIRHVNVRRSNNNSNNASNTTTNNASNTPTNNASNTTTGNTTANVTAHATATTTSTTNTTMGSSTASNNQSHSAQGSSNPTQQQSTSTSQPQSNTRRATSNAQQSTSQPNIRTFNLSSGGNLGDLNAVLGQLGQPGANVDLNAVLGQIGQGLGAGLGTVLQDAGVDNIIRNIQQQNSAFDNSMNQNDTPPPPPPDDLD